MFVVCSLCVCVCVCVEKKTPLNGLAFACVCSLFVCVCVCVCVQQKPNLFQQQTPKQFQTTPKQKKKKWFFCLLADDWDARFAIAIRRSIHGVHPVDICAANSVGRTSCLKTIKLM